MNVLNAALWNSTGKVNFRYCDTNTLSNKLKWFNKQSLDVSYVNCVDHNGVLWYKTFHDTLQSLPLIEVSSISFTDLFDIYKSPRNIDYIALDIEWSEFRALSRFPFDTHVVSLWSIEAAPDAKCCKLLIYYGYVKVKNPFCPKLNEQYFIHKSLVNDYPFEICKNLKY
jgi:hypothetical protein